MRVRIEFTGAIKFSDAIKFAKQPKGLVAFRDITSVTEWTSGLVDQPAIYSRNGVSYMVATHWRSDLKADQIGSLKRAKADGCCATCDAAADAIEGLLLKLFGSLGGSVVTSVPCGHSRVANCLGKRLAQAVAMRTGATFVQCWQDRFVSGVSHPKEFARLPPLDWITVPKARTILIDDVATSGWHMEEALTALRAAGVEAFGVAWIGGRRKGDGEDDEDLADESKVFRKCNWGRK